MDIISRISGMVQLELVSARIERTILLMNAEGIELYDFRQIDLLTGRFWVKRKNFSAALKICTYLEGSLTVLSKRGLYWNLRRLAARPVLPVGIAVILAMYLFLPTRILFVKVEGNASIPTNRILTEAEACGICFGASREAVRSEKMKNQLLERISQLQWAGINTAGCVATISVRERQPDPQPSRYGMVSSLHASRDGYILSATATRGTLLVQPGQAVKAGQMLISGFTDCGITIRAEEAEGEIYAQTNHFYRLCAPIHSSQKSLTGNTYKKYSVRLGKKRINLWKDSGISVDSCDRMYEEYYITLPGGFSLPATLCVETFTEYECIPMQLPQQDLRMGLSAAAKLYLGRHMSAGSIQKESESYTQTQDMLFLAVNYVCQEMISGVRQEQIGE